MFGKLSTKYGNPNRLCFYIEFRSLVEGCTRPVATISTVFVSCINGVLFFLVSTIIENPSSSLRQTLNTRSEELFLHQVTKLGFSSSAQIFNSITVVFLLSESSFQLKYIPLCLFSLNTNILYKHTKVQKA